MADAGIRMLLQVRHWLNPRFLVRRPEARRRRSSRSAGRCPPRRAARRSATARSCPTAAGRPRRCAGRASARGCTGRRRRGSRGSCATVLRREDDAALGARGDHVRGQPVVVSASCSPAAAARARRRSILLVRLRRGHLGTASARVGGHGQRVAVERADHLVARRRRRAPSSARCRRWRPRTRRRRSTWPGRSMSGCTSSQRGDAARPDGEAGLDLVEGEQRAVGVQEVPAGSAR